MRIAEWLTPRMMVTTELETRAGWTSRTALLSRKRIAPPQGVAPRDFAVLVVPQASCLLGASHSVNRQAYTPFPSTSLLLHGDGAVGNGRREGKAMQEQEPLKQ